MKTVNRFNLVAALLIAGLYSVNVSADPHNYSHEADRLYAASIHFSTQLKHYPQYRAYRHEVERFGRDVASFRHAVHERRDHRYLQPRYDELLRYHYRLERRFPSATHSRSYVRSYSRPYYRSYTHDRHDYGHRAQSRRYYGAPARSRYYRHTR
ncbi:MAG: hypothetical protein RQ757_06395 [Pseudomonadales bacterium]|nr:hypothetical protein [Pseudomonadales bacterium]